MATRRGAVPDSLYVECRGDVTALKLFKQGLFHVQGEASQLACAALSPRPGDTVLDLCAAPGGKSATLAQYMENKGTLVSCDAAQNRLTLVGGALERLGVACGRVLHNDAAVYNEAFAGADAVLCWRKSRISGRKRWTAWMDWYGCSGRSWRQPRAM